MDLILFYIMLGVVIGIMSGMFGIGGGMFLTPILLLTGVRPVEAITVSLFYTMGTSVSGMAGHFRQKNTNLKNSLIIGLSGIAATQLAQPLIFFIEKKGYDDTIIPIFYIVLLLYFAFSMLKKSKRAASGAGQVIVQRPLMTLVLIGFTGGFVSSALGVGGGFIIVPLLISFFGESAKKAVGTSIVGVLMIVAAGFTSYALNVEFDYKLPVLLLAGGLLGAQAGVRLTNYFTSAEIKTMLGLLYLTTTLSVLAKLAGQNEAGLAILLLFVLFVLSRSIMRLFKKKRLYGEN
ncbi:sulfite exporter TauE/SafE family protein [Peribacillus sp. SCS-37]|uniref:sulfite exporter TauE/SafE family protein n=1 Tax=Paraperibacillus esterisolvens TaxID=3115296 RepID=UPI003905B2EF